ncbi:MAG: RimK family alpha-L-glutamate ligase [Bacteroidia bacterium]
MKTYSILILTDHRVHKASNPVYSLVPSLRQHPQCAFVDVASRGNAANTPFFQDYVSNQLECLRVSEVFAYQADGQQFVETDYVRSIQDYDVILMRLARPVSTAFMEYLAEQAPQAIFINHPLGIEKTSSKAYLLHFPDLCPPMALCHSVEEILRFAERFPIVLKPLKEYGGKGILKLEDGIIYDGDEQYIAYDYLRENAAFIEQNAYLAMKFLPNVRQGDKRILVVGGEILGASLRMPPPDSWICNVAMGGDAVPAEPTSEEIAIIETISHVLLEEGILIFGADTLVDDEGKRVLSEINTLSVGGFKDIQAQTQKPVLATTIQKIFDYINHAKN